MANPYHDEQGRFSSKAGMKSAVDSLAASGQVSEYLSLRDDYERAAASKDATSAAMNSPWARPVRDTSPLTGSRAVLHKLLTDYGVYGPVADDRVRDGSAVRELQSCKTIGEASEVLSSLGVDEYEAEQAAYDLMSRR